MEIEIPIRPHPHLRQLREDGAGKFLLHRPYYHL